MSTKRKRYREDEITMMSLDSEEETKEKQREIEEQKRQLDEVFKRL